MWTEQLCVCRFRSVSPLRITFSHFSSPFSLSLSFQLANFCGRAHFPWICNSKALFVRNVMKVTKQLELERKCENAVPASRQYVGARVGVCRRCPEAIRNKRGLLMDSRHLVKFSVILWYIFQIGWHKWRGWSARCASGNLVTKINRFGKVFRFVYYVRRQRHSTPFSISKLFDARSIHHFEIACDKIKRWSERAEPEKERRHVEWHWSKTGSIFPFGVSTFSSLHRAPSCVHACVCVWQTLFI